MSVRERVRQFREAGARPRGEDFALARAWLTAECYDAFAGQHPRDVVHAANTARWLLARGHDDPDLIGAALLHDIAKGHQRRADRVAYVLASAGGIVGAIANDDSAMQLRRALARSLAHAEEGATMLAARGASERVIELTRLHHSQPHGDDMLTLLQAADAAS